MKLRQLKYFVSLAQSGSFSQAAEQVHVSQPALSQQIKKLEDELGVQLLERISRGIKLTGAGEQLFDDAIRILDEVRATRDRLNQFDSDNIRGQLKLGVIPTIAPYFLPDLVSHFHAEFPDVRLQIEEQQTDTLLERLRMGEVDHLVLSPPINDNGLVTEILGSEDFYLAVGRNNSLSERETLTIQEINDEPLLLLERGHCLRDQSLSFCEQKQVDPRVVFQGSSLQSILNLVQTGLGSTIVPSMVLNQPAPENVTFIPFENPRPKREIILARRKSMELTEVDKRLMNYCQERFQTQG